MSETPYNGLTDPLRPHPVEAVALRKRCDRCSFPIDPDDANVWSCPAKKIRLYLCTYCDADFEQHEQGTMLRFLDVSYGGL